MRLKRLLHKSIEEGLVQSDIAASCDLEQLCHELDLRKDT